MTNLVQFSAITPDRIVKGYTLARRENAPLRWADSPAKKARILRVLRTAADTNPNSIKVEPTGNGSITILSTNLDGTAYVLYVK